MPNTTAPKAATLTDTVQRLVRGVDEPLDVLAEVLRSQCRLDGVEAAGLLRVERNGRTRVLKLCPAPAPGTEMPAWLLRAVTNAPQVVAAGRSFVDEAPDGVGDVVEPDRPTRSLLLVPLGAARGRHGVAVYVIRCGPVELERTRDRLELTAGLLSLQELHTALRVRGEVIERLRFVVELLEAVNEQERFLSASMALCNELATRWRGERVSLGFLRGRVVRVVAISSTDKFDRRTTLVRDLETAMEECLDQDTEVVYPRPDRSVYVSRSAARLAQTHGPVSVASLPLRRHGRVVGVLTIERATDDPLTSGDLEILRIVCELITPRLLERRDQDRWVGAKAAIALRDAAATLIGPRHTGAKLAAMTVATAVVLVCVMKGEDRVDASFEIAAVEQRVVPAPYDGRLERIEVDPGERVEAGRSVLATLETAELQLQLAAARAERAARLKEADLALRDGKTVDRQIAEAHLRRAEAEIGLLEHYITQARIMAPIDGTIVLGDLKRQVGAPVTRGDVLFEIAELSSLRAELQVPEDRVTELLEDGNEQGPPRGRLASVAHPGDYIAFEIEQVNPVAEVIDGKNVFRVRVRLLEKRPWLRPGMQGVAKIDAGKRSYAALWTRSLVSWIRMRLWL